MNKKLKKTTYNVTIGLMLLSLVGIGSLQYETSVNIKLADIYKSKIKTIEPSQKETILKAINKIIIPLQSRQNQIIAGQLKQLNSLLKAYNHINLLAQGLNKIQKNVNYIDLPTAERIKGANLYIINYSRKCTGSGTVIKIKDKYYVLTCAHLISLPNDELIAKWDNNNTRPLKLINYNRDLDLALFELSNIKPKHYLELSEIEPKIGSQVLVVGNPAGIRNMFTNGIVSLIKEDCYWVTNKIFFGNSGGALIYRGKVVGVLSRLCHPTHNGVSVNYGIVSNLKNIKTFLANTIK